MRYVFSTLTLDTDRRSLARGAEGIHLSRKALDLLILLVAERHRVVPKQEIFDRLWPQTFVVDANLANLIAEIRRAVSDTDHQIIRTVHGTGYSFAGPVTIEGERMEASGASLHVLVFEHQQLRLKEGENVIGREPVADVFLAAKSVSRRHALVRVIGTEATVSDLDSRHGTFVDRKPVHGETALADGAVLRVGNVELVYRRWTGADPTDPLIGEYVLKHKLEFS